MAANDELSGEIPGESPGKISSEISIEFSGELDASTSLIPGEVVVPHAFPMAPKACPNVLHPKCLPELYCMPNICPKFSVSQMHARIIVYPQIPAQF